MVRDPFFYSHRKVLGHSASMMILGIRSAVVPVHPHAECQALEMAGAFIGGGNIEMKSFNGGGFP